MKLRYKNILFDLDGTLTDSQEGIVNSMKSALNALGREINSEDNLARFIGIPLQELFLNHFGVSAGELEKAVFYFRKYYTEKGIFENKIYPGVVELLSRLAETSYLYIATSKLEKNALIVLQHFKIEHFFKGMAGANASGTHAGKAELVLKILNDFQIHRESPTVMIGDTIMDIKAASECKIDSVGVTYGYGSEEELTACNPTFLAHTTDELKSILIIDEN